MKQFIVMCALILVLLFFPAQNILDNINQKKIDSFQETVHKYCQTARTDGRFTSETIKNMQDEISKKCNIDKSKITIEVDTTPRYRLDAFDKRELIHYKVIVPIDQLVAMADFWKLTHEQNSTVYKLEGDVASEVLEE